MKGWIKIHRKLEDSEIWLKPCEWRIIWLHILMNVNFEKTSQFEIGEGFFHYDMMAKHLKVSYGQIDKCLRWLKSVDKVSTARSTRGLRIKVLNYRKYQIVESNESTVESTHGRYSVDTIHKELRINNKSEIFKNLNRAQKDYIRNRCTFYKHTFGKQPNQKQIETWIEKEIIPGKIKTEFIGDPKSYKP